MRIWGREREKTKNLSENWNWLKTVISMILILSANQLFSQAGSNAILLVPIAGKDVTVEEAKSISYDIKNGLINKGYSFLADPATLAKKAANEQKVTGDANSSIQDLGNAYNAENIMECIVDKLSSNYYKVNCSFYHRIKDEAGRNYWESWASSGISEYGTSLSDLSKQINDKLKDRLEKEKQMTESQCRNVNGGFFVRKLNSCTSKTKTNLEQCFTEPIDTVCTASNRTDQCINNCRKNAEVLLVYVILSVLAEAMENEIIACGNKGGKYNKDSFKCELNESDTSKIQNPENGRKPDPAVPDEKKSKSSDHNGWASIIVPGLGHGLKGRQGWGVFFFTTTLLAYVERAKSNDAYTDARKNYNLPLTSNNMFLDFIWYNNNYESYKKSADSARNHSVLFWGLYTVNVITAFAMSPDSSSAFHYGRNPDKMFSWDLGIYRETRQFLSSEKDIGTRYECIFLFRF